MTAGAEGPAPRRLGASFVTGADRYDRLRPGYPRAAAEFLVGRAHARVADIGAGTGKLTAVLRALGHDVVAVEPSAPMRAGLSRAVPGVRVLDGTAEATGLPGASVDVATFGQSWHWADVHRASAELARVLRPGGAVAMAWNVFDHRHGWVDRLEEAMHHTPMAWPRDTQGRDQASDVAPEGPFGRAVRHQVTWVAPVRLTDLVQLVTTRSYYLASDATAQQSLLATVRRAVRRDFPDLADDDVVEVPYVTHCVRYQRRR